MPPVYFNLSSPYGACVIREFVASMPRISLRVMRSYTGFTDSQLQRENLYEFSNEHKTHIQAARCAGHIDAPVQQTGVSGLSRQERGNSFFSSGWGASAHTIEVPFDSIFTPLDLGVVRDISGKGTAGFAVLQQSDTELRVQLKNALSGLQIGNINFSAGYKGIDLLVLGDLNGNRAKEIAVLADNKTATAADTVEMRDSKSGVLIRTISYGTGKDLQQLINLPDLNNSGGAELAVLRANTARVLVKDAKTGLPVNTLDYAVSQPFRLTTVADSNSQTNLAMLGVRAATGQPRADVHDPLSDTFINKVLFDNYGTTVGFISIPDINGNGVAELVRLREQPGPQKLFAEVRDGRTGVLLQGMYF